MIMPIETTKVLPLLPMMITIVYRDNGRIVKRLFFAFFCSGFISLAFRDYHSLLPVEGAGAYVIAADDDTRRLNVYVYEYIFDKRSRHSHLNYARYSYSSYGSSNSDKHDYDSNHNQNDWPCSTS